MNFDKFKNETVTIDILRGDSVVGKLVPIDKNFARYDVRTLARWREENAHTYLTQFPVTIEGTKTWLEKILAKPDKILFWIVADNMKIGHIGLDHLTEDSVEIDNVLRGEVISPGIMEFATIALLNFCLEVLGVKNVVLRVFEDNERAIKLYKKCGFVQSGVIPLKRIHNGWEQSPGIEDAERYFLMFTYTP